MLTNFKKIKPYFAFWLFLRIYASITAAYVSNFSPVLPIEKNTPIWSQPINLANWLYRVFLAPWLRWDAVIYTRIVTSGYIAGDGSTSFHPLYILLSKPLYLIGFDPLLSLLIISSLSTLALFWIFYKLANLDLSPKESLIALLLLASFPLSISLFFAYTESLFLFFSTLALYQMRKRRWFLVIISTFLASLARQQGVFLVFPIIWYAWEDSGKSLRTLLKAWQAWLAALATPIGLFSWTIYRLFYLREGIAELNSWQGFIYSVLLSPSAKKIFPDQALVWPWTAFMIALPKLINGPDIGDVMSLAIGLGFIVLFVLAWKHMQPAYRIYSLVIVLISFSMSTGSYRIYLSLPRHLLLAIPVFIGLSLALKKPWQRFALIGLQFSIQTFMLFLYVAKLWIP